MGLSWGHATRANRWHSRLSKDFAGTVSVEPSDTRACTHQRTQYYSTPTPIAVSTPSHGIRTSDKQYRLQINGARSWRTCKSLSRALSRDPAHPVQKTWLHGSATSPRLFSQHVGQTKPLYPRTSCTRFISSPPPGPGFTSRASAMSSLGRLDQSIFASAFGDILDLRALI